MRAWIARLGKRVLAKAHTLHVDNRLQGETELFGSKQQQ